MSDPPLSPHTLLRRAPGVRTRSTLWDARSWTPQTVRSSMRGLAGFAALAMFARPLALREAIARLESGEGTETDFLPTVSVINMPIDEGALADADRGPTRGWSDPVEHARMLHDDRRTGDYLDALAQAVRPGGVMLDIDTGRGVLAIAAPPAGARRVRAVEASDIAEVADRVFATNGVQER